jgi:hypothetical protein
MPAIIIGGGRFCKQTFNKPQRQVRFSPHRQSAIWHANSPKKPIMGPARRHFDQNPARCQFNVKQLLFLAETIHIYL